MKNIREKLKKLDLSEKEIDIYLAVLKLKQANITQIAEKANIKRTSAYHCLQNLINKNLVIKQIKNDKKIYIIEEPQEGLNNILREKKEIINSLIPEIKEIFGQASIVPEIKIYRNTSGLRKMFEDILNSKEKYSRYYLSDFILEDILGEKFIDEFVKKRIERKIVSISLRSFDYKPTREKGIEHAKQYRKVKFLPNKIKIKPYMAIYDNKVVVISTKEEKLGFIIESQEFAQAQKVIFDMLWDNVAI